MALRQPYALINSEFNAFLYAPIGDEGNGMVLSVFSALTRLDIDPWREAAGLADLSRENAIKALAPIIARLPDGRWTAADAGEIAARLVAFLPQRGFAGPATSPVATPPQQKRNSRAGFLAILFALAAISVLATVLHHHPSSGNDDSSPHVAAPSSHQ